jgi:hypothetical protein
VNPKLPVWTACALALSQLLLADVASAQATNVVCERCVNNSDLANNSVTSEKIQDGAVKAVDIAASAVKTATINNGAVTFGKLATGVRDALDGAIADLTTVVAEDSAISVAEANCPSNRIAVSASCVCDDNNGNSNFGVLFACAVDGNGAFAACFDEAGSFNPVLNSPLAIVQAVCLGAESTDGTPWAPTAEGLAPSPAGSGADGDAAAQAQRHKEQYETLQSRAAELRAKAAQHRTRLLD